RSIRLARDRAPRLLRPPAWFPRPTTRSTFPGLAQSVSADASAHRATDHCRAARHIVKAAHPTFPGAADMLRNDWAALQLLIQPADDGEPLCARFYGGDPRVPLVAMEDLGAGDGSPRQVVEGDDPDAATASLLAYIRAV